MWLFAKPKICIVSTSMHHNKTPVAPPWCTHQVDACVMSIINPVRVSSAQQLVATRQSRLTPVVRQWVKVGRWDTFTPACKLTKRASATKRAVDVKTVGGWYCVRGGGGHSNIGAACKTAHRGRGTDGHASGDAAGPPNAEVELGCW
jgi:hypothetical protein